MIGRRLHRVPVCDLVRHTRYLSFFSRNSRKKCWIAIPFSARLAKLQNLPLPRSAPPMPCKKAMETRTTMFRNIRKFSNLFSKIAPAAAVVFMAACSVRPNYKRPAVNVPTAYRGPGEPDPTLPQPQPATATPAPAPAAATTANTNASTVTSIGDEKWWEVFQDKELQGLIRTALKNNYDVRIAATRVLQAQAQLGITRADQFPTLTGGGNVSSVRNPTIGPIPSYEITLGRSCGKRFLECGLLGPLSPGNGSRARHSACE